MDTSLYTQGAFLPSLYNNITNSSGRCGTI